MKKPGGENRALRGGEHSQNNTKKCSFQSIVFSYSGIVSSQGDEKNVNIHKLFEAT
jgi:hypothetical protein